MRVVAAVAALTLSVCDSSKDEAKSDAAAGERGKQDDSTPVRGKPADDRGRGGDDPAPKTAAKGGAAVKETAPSSDPPAAPDDPSAAHGLELVGGKLFRLAPSGKADAVTPAAGATGCAVDDVHRVVWLAGDSQLAVYDPSDGHVRTVVKNFESPAGGVQWQVHRQGGSSPFPNVTAGNTDGLDSCVALVVKVAAKPSASGEVIAEGDREWYCFEEGEEAGSLDETKLNADEAPVDAGYDKAKLVGASILRDLDARHTKEGPRARPKLTAPTPPKVEVDKSRCMGDGEDCGEARYVGGERLWWVVTDTSRGDFFHETRQLYDAKTETFWDPISDKRQPGAFNEFEEGLEIQVSPDGKWGVYGEHILSLTEAKITGRVDGSFCGWE